MRREELLANIQKLKTFNIRKEIKVKNRELEC